MSLMKSITVSTTLLRSTTPYMAKWRDDGMPKAEMIAGLEGSDYTGSKLKVLKHAVDVAFEYPKLSPKEEGNTAYKRCLKVIL